MFQLYLLNVPKTVEQLTERITTAFTSWIERNEFFERAKTVEEEANGLHVDLSTSQNEI